MIKRNFKKITTLILLSLALSASPVADLNAQCPMCRMSAQKNLDGGGTAGKGLNKGILYILALPYAIVASVGLIWYYNRKEEDELGFDPQQN